MEFFRNSWKTDHKMI